jgi:hypothetical protein
MVTTPRYTVHQRALYLGSMLVEVEAVFHDAHDANCPVKYRVKEVEGVQRRTWYVDEADLGWVRYAVGK